MNAIDQQRPPEAPDAAGIYHIWPGDGRAPGTEHWTHRESTMQIPWTSASRRLTRNVVVPSLTAFLPEPGKANGTAMIVAPGGAFHFLMIDHEGYDMARWLARRARHHRLRPQIPAGAHPRCRCRPARFPQRAAAPAAPARPDGRRAALQPCHPRGPPLGRGGRPAGHPLRAPARRRLGLDPRRIGIGGFSAGGAVTMGPVFEHDAESPPDFAVGIYPAYRAGLPLPADAPPLFLAISDDDKSVAPLSSVRLYEAWHHAGIPCELHVFGNGAHGFGFGKSGLLSDPWADMLQSWLGVRGLLPKRP